MTSSSIGDGNLGEQFQQTPQTPITAFLAKLWALVNDPTCDDLISWDAAGVSFHVYDQARFAREILPRYFKHNNFASFIRQLNMYGFRKISTIEHGSLKNERDDIEFAHPHFIRGQDGQLEFIKRRAPENQPKTNVQPVKIEAAPRQAPTPAPSSVSNPPAETKPLRAIEVGHLLDDVRSLHSKQNSLTDKLFHLEDENQALWREIGSLRQKHSKQQQIVTKLMEFLVHILSSVTQHRRSVEQNASNTSQQRSATASTIANSHSLKRKPAALMLSEEPSKRINRQGETITVNPTSLFVDLRSNPQVEPRITINELTETDPGVWMPSNDELPLVDLVPSPPPSIPTPMSIHGNSSTQQRAETSQPTAKFGWIDSINNLTLPTSTNNIDQNDTFPPDFFLTPEQDQDPNNTTQEQIIDGINTPCTSLQRKSLIVPLKDRASEKTISTNDSSLHPNCSFGFSLDEFTGDVDNIQASLDNIREYMFHKLPDGTLIDDLFSDENVLLSPFLPTSTTSLSEIPVENKTENNFDYSSTISNRAINLPILDEVLPPTAINLNENNAANIDSTILESNKNDSLLDHLINQNQTIEHQQQNQIKQLESDKFQLQARLNVLDRQKKN